MLLSNGRPTVLLALTDLKYWLECAQSSLRGLKSQSTIEDCQLSSRTIISASTGSEPESTDASSLAPHLGPRKGIRNKEVNHNTRLAGKKLRHAIKKTWFLMAWANEQHESQYNEMADTLAGCLDNISESYFPNRNAGVHVYEQPLQANRQKSLIGLDPWHS